MASATNFIIVPLSFLSGTFYSIDRLPIFLKNISELNPFFYIIDGFRYGFLGTSDGSITFGFYYLILLNYYIIPKLHWLKNKSPDYPHMKSASYFLANGVLIIELLFLKLKRINMDYLYLMYILMIILMMLR